MNSIDYYNDTKFCPQCNKYVCYLQSVHASYCTECGGEVRLFSKEDWEKFQREEKYKPASHRRVDAGLKEQRKGSQGA